MAVGKLREDYAPLPAARAQPEPQQVPLDFERGALPSPARALQERLERSHAMAVAEDLDRWSTRRALAFIIASSVALWMAVLVAGAQATHVAPHLAQAAIA